MTVDGEKPWTNDKTLREFDPPLAVEHLIYEVHPDAYELWKATEFEMWTKAEADRFPSFLGKETWLRKGDWLQKGEWYRVSIVIYWTSVEAWFSIDPAWLDAQEARFAEVVGAGNYRLVYAAHEENTQWYKVSEYR